MVRIAHPTQMLIISTKLLIILGKCGILSKHCQEVKKHQKREGTKMKRLTLLLCAGLLMFTAFTAMPKDNEIVYNIKPIAKSEMKVIPDALKKQLREASFQVTDKQNKLVCEIWLRKAIEVKELPSEDGADGVTNYSMFPEGAFLGVIRFKQKSTNCRGNTIFPGIYTIRYMLMPEDGDHIGVAAYKDFIMLLPAMIDKGAPTMDRELIIATALKSSEHPHNLALVPLEKKPEKTPVFKIDESNNLALYIKIAKLKAIGTDKTRDVIAGVVLGLPLGNEE